MLEVVKIFVILSMLLCEAPTEAAIYENKEFGIRLELPEKLPICSGTNDSHDHGVVIFLSSKEIRGCGDDRTSRSISIFAFYNVVDETRTLEDYLQWECTQVLKGMCIPEPSTLKIGQLKSLSARINHSDGWIDIIVVAQGGRAPNQPMDDPTSSVNYSMVLHTTLSNLKRDMLIFRNVLLRTEISPPGR